MFPWSPDREQFETYMFSRVLGDTLPGSPPIFARWRARAIVYVTGYASEWPHDRSAQESYNI
eukprot:4483518-Pyramimonas_sp.AAC.1